MGTAIQEKATPLHVGRKVTREQYLDLREDGFKYDMLNGVLQLTPSPDFDHGEAAGNFGHALVGHNKKVKAGRVAHETDVLLPDGGDVVRPDIAFLKNAHLDRIERVIHGAPDMAVEILSDSTRERDLNEKADRYLKNGVQEYWILDPRERTIQVWNNRGDKWEKRAGDSLKSELLEGFEVKVSEVFA